MLIQGLPCITKQEMCQSWIGEYCYPDNALMPHPVSVPKYGMYSGTIRRDYLRR